MSTVRQFSLVPHLRDAIAHFCRDGAVPNVATVDGLCDLVVTLANLREEGEPLFPTVVLCNDCPTAQGKLSNSLRAFHVEGGPIETPTTMRAALKRCARLAEHGWFIVMDSWQGRLQWHLVREGLDPTAPTLREYASAEYGDAVLLVTQVAHDTIELIASEDHRLLVQLSAAKAPKEGGRDSAVERLAQAVSSHDDHERLARFWRRCFERAFRQGHGALVAVVKGDGADIPAPLLADMAVLSRPIDIGRRVRHCPDKREQTFLVESFITIIGGMLATDGITVMSTDGKVVGFNCFLHEGTDGDGKPRPGGARRRAFATLAKLVDDGLLAAAYFRSMDGVDAFHGADVEPPEVRG